jgi:hypothetical protein
MPESPPPDPPEDEDALPAFTPVHLARSRHDGWTHERQRGFIAALAESGIVARAARAVGMGPTSAYALRRRPGAESFVAAWDMVEDEARERAFAYVLDRAINGATRPRFCRGRFVGTEHGAEDRMAMAALRAAAVLPPTRSSGAGKVNDRPATPFTLPGDREHGLFNRNEKCTESWRVDPAGPSLSRAACQP